MRRAPGAGFWPPATRRLRTLNWLASKKRQGTKSREVWHPAGNESYEDRMSAPLSMVSAMRARGDVHLFIPGNRGECSGHLGGRVKCSNGRLVN
jgi:hypothetical protein